MNIHGVISVFLGTLEQSRQRQLFLSHSNGHDCDGLPCWMCSFCFFNGDIDVLWANGSVNVQWQWGSVSCLQTGLKSCVYLCGVAWSYFDYRKPGHLDRHWDTQMAVRIDSKISIYLEYIVWMDFFIIIVLSLCKNKSGCSGQRHESRTCPVKIGRLVTLT